MVANGDSSFGVLDANALRSLIELVGDDREALAEIVDAFLEEAPQRLTELRQESRAPMRPSWAAPHTR